MAQASSKAEQKDNKEKSEEDKLVNAWNQLKLVEKPCTQASGGSVELSVRRLQYCGLKKAFPKELCNANLSMDQMKRVIQSFCGLEVDSKSLPLATFPLQNEFNVTVEYKEVSPPVKPSLLLAILMLANRSNGRQCDNFLSGVDFIGSRNTFHRLIATLFPTSDSNGICRLNFCKFSESGPIFIERSDYYTDMAGSVGKLFKQKFVTERSDQFQRFYVLNELAMTMHRSDRGSAGNGEKESVWTVLCSNEVDGLDVNGEPVELATKPKFKKHDASRLAQKWFQTLVGGMNHLIFGSFEHPYVPKRPRVRQPKGSPWSAIFKPENIHDYKLSELENMFPSKKRADMLELFGKCLDTMKKECKVSEQIYELMYDVNEEKFEVKIAENLEKEFPISEALLKTAEKAMNQLNHMRDTTPFATSSASNAASSSAVPLRDIRG